MKTRKLNRTQVIVTELGFGAAVIGNLYRAISDEEAVDASRRPGRLGFATSTRHRTTGSACPNVAWAGRAGHRCLFK